MASTRDLQRIGEILKGGAAATWVFYGDSITQGVRHTHGGRSYPEIFGEHIHWEMKRFKDIVINAGVDGGTTENGLNDFEWSISRFDPSVVFLMFAMNDCQPDHVSPASFQENVCSLVQKIRAIDAIPVLQTPNPVMAANNEASAYKSRDRLACYVSIISDVAECFETVLIDHWSCWQLPAPGLNLDTETYECLLDDELHPNAKGHEAMASLILEKLRFRVGCNG